MPVYTAALEALRTRIRQGDLRPGDPLGTEMGLSTQYGISRSSVRTAIDALVAEGVVRREAGRGLFVAGQPRQVVTVVVPLLRNIWIAVAQGAKAAGLAHGIHVQVMDANGDVEADVRALRELAATGAGGAIIGSLHHVRLNEAMLALHQQGFPFVVADQQFADLDLPAVVFDDHAAGYRVGQELLARGHRRIAFVGYTQAGSTSRLDGLRDALNDAGVPLPREYLVTVPLRELAAIKPSALLGRVQHLFAQTSRPTAVVCHNEELAALMLRDVLRAAGLRVPTDVSVVTFGLVADVEFLMPRLSLLQLPAEEMGRAAMRLLLPRLRQPGLPPAVQVLAGTWLEGESVAPI